MKNLFMGIMLHNLVFAEKAQIDDDILRGLKTTSEEN